MNLSSFNLDIYSQLPQQVVDMIKLLAQNPTKWAFANRVFDLVTDVRIK